MTTEIKHTTIEYKCSNNIDQQIMDALANCMHLQSGVLPLQVLEALENLPKKKAA